MGRRVLAAVAATLVMTCGTQATAQAQEVSAGCGWALKGNQDVLNVAFPDAGAQYWLAAFAPVPGTRVKITGEYARARYFSFNAYDATQTPVGSLADHRIAPDPGSQNPFTTGRRTKRKADTYTAYLEFTDKPATPAPNTFYSGSKNPSVTVLYRIYVSDDAASLKGSVPLPDITLETSDGSRTIAKLGRCEPVSPDTGGFLNGQINSTTYPTQGPRQAPWIRAEDPPYFDRAGNIVPASPATGDGTKPGFLSNEDNAYVRGSFARKFGDVFVIRAKVPSFPNNRKGEKVTLPRQVRYWSICMNEFATQRYVECISDYQAVVNKQTGMVTIVVADPSQRPSNANRAHRINFLPWPGAYYDALILYRHMLPAPEFPFAVQRMEINKRLTDEMGPYTLVARYCTRETIETKGVDACFAA